MKEISATYFVKLFLKHIVPVVIITALFAAVAFSYASFFVKPQYKATAAIVISNGAAIDDNQTGSNKILSSDLSASLILVDTCVDLLKTPGIYQQLQEKTGDSYYYAQLMHMISLSARSESSLFIDVSAVADSRQDAIAIVNDFVELAPDYIVNTLPSSLTKVVAVADKSVQTAPRVVPFTIVGLLLGFILSMLFFFLKDFFDQSLRGEDDFTNNYSVPILGVIPDFLSAPMSGGYGNDLDR